MPEVCLQEEKSAVRAAAPPAVWLRPPTSRCRHLWCCCFRGTAQALLVVRPEIGTGPMVGRRRWADFSDTEGGYDTDGYRQIVSNRNRSKPADECSQTARGRGAGSQPRPWSGYHYPWQPWKSKSRRETSAGRRRASSRSSSKSCWKCVGPGGCTYPFNEPKDLVCYKCGAAWDFALKASTSALRSAFGRPEGRFRCFPGSSPAKIRPGRLISGPEALLHNIEYHLFHDLHPVQSCVPHLLRPSQHSAAPTF